jgi:hypothetical protein
MSELEGMSAEQQEQAARLFKFVKANPTIEKDIRRQAKKLNPTLAAPDIELEDALTAQAADFDKRLKERDERDQLQQQQARRSEAHVRCREAGLDPAVVEKCMVDDNIVNYDTAIKYLQAQAQLAPATHDSITPMSLPDTKGLWENKVQFGRTTAHDAINDLRSGRVRLAR